jgi:hypothetical protein
MARRSRRVLLTAALAVALHLAVGASSQAQPPSAPVTAPTPAATATSTATATAPAGVLRLRSVSIVDQQGLGLEAFRLLIPAGCSVEGGVVWPLPLSCPHPAALRVRVFDPQGTDELNIFPARPFAWSAQGIPFFPTGSLYLGSEVHPPIDALQYIRNPNVGSNVEWRALQK